MLRALLILIVLLASAAAVAEGHEERCSGASGGPCPSYDVDGDGIRNEPPYPPGPDNCVEIKNADQDDADGDGAGDACDSDDDADGVPDAQDNCRTVQNPGQEDADGNGYGDLCPPTDTDGDGVTDDVDNCPNSGPGKPDQKDLDQDRRGDVCDGDRDGDLVYQPYDNCPDVENGGQEDRDGNDRGSACDPDEVRAASEPTPTLGPGGGGGDGGAAATDRAAPSLTVGAAASWSADDLRGRAPLSVRCSEACGLNARLTLGGRLLATGTATLGASGRTYVFFAPRRGAVARVARLRSRVRAVLTVRAVDEAGNRRTATRRVWLRR